MTQADIPIVEVEISSESDEEVLSTIYIWIYTNSRAIDGDL